MTLPFAEGARFWCLTFLGLGLPACVALTAPRDGAGSSLFVPGLQLADVLGLGPAGAERLGHGAGIAVFLALGVAALAVATRGRTALLALPASLAAAAGPDGLVLALATLAAALLTDRPLTGRRRPARLAGAALAIALAVLIRPACAPLAGMLLVPFPPAGRLARFCRDRLSLATLGLAAPSFVTWALLPAIPGDLLSPGAGPGSTSLPASLPMPSPLPWPLVGLWAAALLVPPLALRRGPLPPRAERLWLAGGALIGLWLMVLTRALAPAPGPDGLQARELLPLAPMLILAFARGRIGTAAALRWPALLPVLAAAADAVTLPLLALR